MNSPITFPPAAPVLKLTRPSGEKWAATLAEERRRLQEDQEALREREENLREYEARLRTLQAEIDAVRAPASVPVQAMASSGRSGSAGPFQMPSSRSPFVDSDAALRAAWEKLHRARELLEAEQTHLRDDRIAVREHEMLVQQREEAVAQREARMAQREALMAAEAAEPARVAASDEGESAMARFTTAPFKIARAVMGGKK